MRSRVRAVAVHCGIGLLVPALLLFNAFVIPEPASHPLIYLAISPTKVMPFVENREFMRELTLAVFGRQTPNDAPVLILILIIFWFVVGVIGSVVVSAVKASKASNHA